MIGDKVQNIPLDSNTLITSLGENNDISINDQIIYVSTTNDLDSITGVQSVNSLLYIINNSATNTLVLKNNNSSSLAINRIFNLDGNDYFIAPKNTAVIAYDTTNKQWNIVKTPPLNGTNPCYGRLICPMGEIGYFNLTGTNIVISAISDGSSNMVVVNPTTTTKIDTGFDNGGSNNGRLRYIGTPTRMFHTACTISVAPTSGANDQFVLGIAKNGVVDPDCKVIQLARNTGDTKSTAIHCMFELSTNDYIELYVGNLTTTADMTIKSLNLFAMGM